MSIRPDAEKNGEPVRWGYPSPCHPSAQVQIVPVWIVHGSGRSEEIGIAEYCPWEDGYGRNWVQCRKLLKIRKSFANWPEDLPRDKFFHLAVMGPCYWRGYGYHVAHSAGRWQNFKAIDCVPPYKNPEEMDGLAQVAIKFRKYGIPGVSSRPEVVDELPPPSPAQDGYIAGEDRAEF